MIVLYILLAIVVLLFMVLIHELGHYIAGRVLKFKITEFSIGFGKAIFSRTNKRGEKISLRLFPLGGYCAFAGENGTDAEGNPTSDKDAFTSQKPWKRIIVFLAGVTFNFLTAIVFSFILLVSVGYDIYKVNDFVKIDNVIEYQYSSYNPETDGLKEGDVVFKVDGTKVDFAYSKTFQTLLNEAQEDRRAWIKENTVDGVEPDFSQYKSPTFYVRRDGKKQEVKVPFIQVKYLSFDANNEPIYVKDENGEFKLDSSGNKIQEVLTAYTLGGRAETDGAGAITVTGINYTIYRHSFGEALARCIPFAFGLAWIVLKSLWMLITFQVGISGVGGTVTAIATMATATQANMLNLLVLIPLISANLAVFNILPIPALDGAHVVFTLIEWIRGKPIKREVENMIHSIGLFVLFGLVILLDILHFVL